MSKYTTELRFICETLAGYDTSQGYGQVNDIVNKSWDKIFDFDFPMFDPEYRSVLCKKILKHYYTREIGFETVGLWKLKLECKMQEIMPYYNKLYEADAIKFNPLYDVDYTKEHEGEDSGESEDSGTHTGTIGDVGTHTGTVTDSGTHTGTVSDASTHTGTISDAGSHNATIGDDGSHTGTVTDAGTHTGTVGDSGSHTGTISDEYSKEGNVDDVKNDDGNKTDWNIFSDTPQGALTNVNNETYLTDARKITSSHSDDITNERDYDETGDSTKTFNEHTSNTTTYNEGNGNTRTYNEANDNERTIDEENENLRTFNEGTGNQRTYNEGSGNQRTFNEGTGNQRTFNEGTGGVHSFSNTGEYIEHIYGKTPGKSYTSLIVEYRNSLINIDTMIIDELNKLFMLVW